MAHHKATLSAAIAPSSTREAMTEARRRHDAWIEQYFSGPLGDAEIRTLTRAFEKLSDQVRPLRPGRISR